ncbi:MAG: hypothetical protein ACFCVF_05970 [Kineosporiaceae bacterium]
MSAALREQIRAHITSEARVLSWLESDAAGEAGPGEVHFTDLDSFTFVQLVLSVEAEYDVEILERLNEGAVTSFDDLADLTLECMGDPVAGPRPE